MSQMTLTAEAPALAQRLRWLAWRRLGVAFLLALAGLAAGWYGLDWWTAGRFTERTDDAYVSGDVTGIAPRVSGVIVSVPVTDNQAVRAGDVLVRIDDRDFRAELAKAEAAVASAQASLADLAATRELQYSLIAQAEADIAATGAETARTRDDWSRYRKLVGLDVVSTQMFQQSETDYKRAMAAGDKARAAVAAARRQLGVLDAREGQARAQLNQARAGLDTARLNLEYTVVRAPIDGTVGNRSARDGGYASAGNLLMSLVPARGLWVDANFKENQMAAMRPGLPAVISADVLPGEEFHGTIASLSPATGAQFSVLPPENATGNFTKIVQRVPVRILLQGEAGELGRLRPGLSVTASVDTRPDRGPDRGAAR